MITKFEGATLERAVKIMIKKMPQVSAIIYIHKDVSVCRNHIERRGRVGELSKVDIPYLTGTFLDINHTYKRKITGIVKQACTK